MQGSRRKSRRQIWWERWEEARANFRDYRSMLWHSSVPQVMLILLVGLIISGWAITITEGKLNPKFAGFWHSVWYAIVSMTTTGYGDLAPETALGRVVGSIVILLGVVIVSFFTATVSSLFVAAKIREGKGLEQIHYRDHVVVCGFGSLTRRLFDSLLLIGGDETPRVVLVADIPGNDVEELLSHYEKLDLKFTRGDWAHEAVLKRANVGFAQTVIVLPDESLATVGLRDEKTILATLAVKALNPKVKLFAHITLPDNRVFLQRAQADEIFLSDEHLGYMMASRTMRSGVPQAARDMFTAESPSRLSVTTIPEDLVGKTFADVAMHFFQKGAILIGLTREETPLEAADILTSDTSALDEFIRRKFQEAGLGAADKTLTRARINPARDTKIDSRDEALLIGGQG